jgi:hypothetical protein
VLHVVKGEGISGRSPSRIATNNKTAPHGRSQLKTGCRITNAKERLNPSTRLTDDKAGEDIKLHYRQELVEASPRDRGQASHRLTGTNPEYRGRGRLTIRYKPT